VKLVRADLVIATCALLISGGATISSLYQTKVIANQLSSSVWPYLSITSSTSTGSAFDLGITNNGLGPALVGGVTLSLDGHILKSYREGEARITMGLAKNVHPKANASFSSVGPTTVIRAGETFQMIGLKGPVMKYVGDLGSRLKLTVCYCSLLGQCWSVTAQKPRESVSGCAHQNGSIDY
jgi:hypothetical protein